MSRKQYYEDDEHWFCVDKIYGGEAANFVKYYEINIVETLLLASGSQVDILGLSG